MLKRKRFTLCGLCLILVTMFVSGCTVINIQNSSELDVRVIVLVPDHSAGYTRFIEPGETATTFSNFGGRYTVTTLPDEEYRKALLNIRDEIAKKLFQARDRLSSSDVAWLADYMQRITDALARLSQQGASCSGNVPDFETVTVSIRWDEKLERWEMNCP